MLMATALVLFMTIGLGLFYAGLVRAKNSLNTFMMCIAALGVVTVSWALVGYSLAFGDGSGFIGNFDYALLKDVGFEPFGEHDHPAPRLLRVPGELLHHHRGPGLRRGRGADALPALPRVHRASGRSSSTRSWRTGSSAAASSRRTARSTSPAACRSRWGRASAPWPPRSSWAGVWTTAAMRPPAPQHALRAARRRAAVVRLVRVQRR